MPDQPYTNREIDQLHSSLMDKMESHNQNTMTKLNSIESQTKKTNGRVSSLENWRWFLTGAVVIISMMVIPLIVFIYAAGL